MGGAGWKRRVVVAGLAGAVAAALSACGDGDSPDGGIKVLVEGRPVPVRTEQVTQQALGERWPLTVAEATLVCVPDLAEHGAFYVADGHAFAANGASATMARLRNIDVVVDGRAQRPVSINTEDPTGDRLWAISPQSLAYSEAFPGEVEREWLARVSIGVMLDEVGKIGCGG